MPGIKQQLRSRSKNAFAILRRILPIIILFEIIYKAVTLLIVKPLLLAFLQLMLQVTGHQLALNDEILTFFLTVSGIIAAVVLIVISALFIYYEFAVIIILAYCGVKGHDITLRGAMGQGWRSLKMLRSPSLIGFSAYALLLLPVANLGYSSSLLPVVAIPNFITGELAKMTAGPFLVFLIYAVVFVVFFCSIFTLPIMVLREVSFGKAWGESFRLLKTAGLRLLGVYGLFLVVWAVLYRVPKTILSMIFFVSDVSLERIAGTFGFSWQTILLCLAAILLFLVQMFLMPVLLVLVVAAYEWAAKPGEIAVDLDDPRLVKGARNPVSAENLRLYWKKFTGSRLARIISIPVAVVLVFAIIFGLARMFAQGYTLHEPIVIGHRGSAYGVENTIEAINSAVDAGADYAEIDILISADGKPMVIHDTNLERLAGVNENVYDLTAAELSELTLSQNGYSGKISTLDEIIDFAKGKIRLAIELKPHGKEKIDIIDTVFAVLAEKDFTDQCIFLSMEYSLVAEINQKHPNTIAGFCLFGNVGEAEASLVRSMEIDFVVIEEAMAKPSVIYGFRGGWIPVYVWTVNDPRNMARYLEMGIIGLVTDQPYDGVQVVREFVETTDIRYVEEENRIPIK